MKHRGSFLHRMDARDRHNGQRDKPSRCVQFTELKGVAIVRLLPSSTIGLRSRGVLKADENGA